MLMQSEAQRLFRYDPKTGKLYWRVSVSRLRAGTEAGTIDRHGYRMILVQGRKYAGHRVIWLLTHGAWPPEQIDHQNGDRADNRLVNLRLATHSQNQHNARCRVDNVCGVKGVRWRKGKYEAAIAIHNRVIYLGRHTTVEGAHKAYCAAATKYHKEFANSG